MSILRKISGRDAVPVWTLPFVIGASMTADKLARILAMRWDSDNVELTAFKLDADGFPVMLSPKQWDRIIENLELLQAQLEAMDGGKAEQNERWRRESVKRLPADAFVWRDECAAWFSKHELNRSHHALHEYGDEEIPNRPGDDSLDLEPLIPTEILEHFHGYGRANSNPPLRDSTDCLQADQPSGTAIAPAPDKGNRTSKTRTRRQWEIRAWLREKWKEMGKPAGAAFFQAIKKYAGEKGSPIVRFYGEGESAGIEWRSSNGATGEWKRKTIQTLVSEFKREDANDCQEP